MDLQTMIDYFAGDVYSFKSTPESSASLMPLYHLKRFVFDVAACNDVRVILMETPGLTNTSAYDITIGTAENTMDVIRRAHNGEWKMRKEEIVPLLLNCYISKRFWVSWAEGEIRAGVDDPYDLEFIRWKDPGQNYPRVTTLSLETDQEGMWSFKREQGNVHVPHTYTLN